MQVYRIHYDPWIHSYKELQWKKVHLTCLFMKWPRMLSQKGFNTIIIKVDVQLIDLERT